MARQTKRAEPNHGRNRPKSIMGKNYYKESLFASSTSIQKDVKSLILILLFIYGIPTNSFGGNFTEGNRKDKEIINKVTSCPIFYAKCM